MDTNQLQHLSETLKISPVEIIREEIELIILDKLAQSNFSANLVFKGGTALRLCYNSPRFSQDLDFNAKGVAATQLEKVLNSVQSDSGEIKIKDMHDKRYTLFALLTVVSSHLKQPFSIKIEISKKEYKLKNSDVLPKVATSPVSYLSPIILTYSLERILKEKKIALRTRREARDYFDLWFIAEKTGKKISFPSIKIAPSKFKGELNQHLPLHLQGWADSFLKQYGQH